MRITFELFSCSSSPLDGVCRIIASVDEEADEDASWFFKSRFRSIDQYQREGVVSSLFLPLVCFRSATESPFPLPPDHSLYVGHKKRDRRRNVG